MNKYDWGELGLKILYVLSVGIMIPAAFVAPNVPKAMAPLLRELAKKIDAKPQALQRSLLSLKHRKLVTIRMKKGNMSIVISVDGKERLVRGTLQGLQLKKPAKWDGKWRIIIFDVPEKRKGAREALRKKFCSLGFLRIQKSCFVYPYECREEIDIISSFFDVVEDITYIIAESFEGEREAREYFTLK